MSTEGKLVQIFFSKYHINFYYYYRMAVERELDKTETNLGNIIFDESGYIILYPTMLGVKMVNLYTNRCIKIMGKPENIRPMRLTLFQVFDKSLVIKAPVMKLSHN